MTRHDPLSGKHTIDQRGITGERAELPAALREQLAFLRTATTLPLCVGFGVSRAEQVRSLRDVADGVIVGSALVRVLERTGSVEETAKLAGELAAALLT
jgi:tryptophan synthase alpha chain